MIYTRKKYKEQGRLDDGFLPHARRCDLIRAALEGHAYLRLDAWDGQECEAGYHTPLREAVKPLAVKPPDKKVGAGYM